MNLNNRIPLALALAVFTIVGSGCGGDQISATQEMVKQQQEQIEQQQQEIDALKNTQSYTPGVASSSSGGCDRAVENAATERGGERLSSGDFHKALDYYNDALTACPSSDQAQVNVARTYEALGNKPAAIKHYRIAAESNSATVSDASEEAKQALIRLQASLMP